VLLALALAPGIYLCKAMYLKDKYEPEPKRLLFAAFLAGCLVLVPVALVEVGLAKLLRCEQPGLRSVLITAFVVAGAIEEMAKFCVLRFYAYPKADFNEPFDGIVYGSFIALGFATTENLFYVLEHGFGVGIFRMFISVPAHYAWGVILGYYVGKAKFEPHNQMVHMLRGLLFAALLHGTFDALLMQRVYPALVLCFVAPFGISLRIARREIKELQTDSMWRFGNRELAVPPVIVEGPDRPLGPGA
jgi:RsiW-degrading membrane proteinase PrsW (M82 family)